MSALGHDQTSRHVRVMSVIALKADIHQRGLHVHLVPIADVTVRNLSSGDGLRDSVWRRKVLEHAPQERLLPQNN
jgi:hypothetical protein